MLPLRSVGRSNFVRVLRKNLTTLIQKRHILMRTAVLYIYIYNVIYIYICVCVCVYVYAYICIFICIYMYMYYMCNVLQLN